MMPLGGGKAIITLRVAVRDRGRRRGYQRSWEVICHHSCPFALQVAERGFVAGCRNDVCRVLLLEEVRIGKHATCPSLGSLDEVAPDSEARHVLSGEGVPTMPPFNLQILPEQNRRAKRNKSIYDEPPVSGISQAMCLFNNGAAERVFSSAFCVSSSVSEVLRFSASNTRIMTGFCCPPYALCGLPILVCARAKGWDGFRFNPILKNVLRTRTLLRLAWSGQSGKEASGEVHAKKSVDKLNVREFYERFCIPNGVSVQLVDGEAVSTEKSTDNSIFFTKEQFNAGLRFPLPSLFREFLHFTQIPPAYIHPNIVRVLMRCNILSMLLPGPFIVGGAKGHVLVRGVWAGLSEHPERPFSLNRSLVLPSMDKRGRVVEWVEKTSFDRLNKLFEITAAERHHQTLLTARNLLALCPGAPGTPRHVEHVSPNGRKEGKRGLWRKAPGDKRSVPSPPTGAPAGKKKKISSFLRLPSVSSGSGHLVGLNGSGPSMPAAERMALLVEEATSVYQPGSSLPDAGVARASCAETLPPMAPPMEETGVEKQGLPLCESSSLTLVPVKGPATRSCSSAQEDHPEESETEMAEENPTDPMLVPDEGLPEKIQPAMNDGGPEPGEESHPSALSGGSPVDEAVCTSTSPFSYAELGEMLKQIPSGSDVAAPLAKMFEAAEMVYLILL
ncbi:hypothetical protein CK203_106095 [Vitis vinifera]|uniref:Uncharacterized protein n=1 Tax=Vitis vinifera TaxID=29760 RepID=A0A438CXC9_VITVI|nr:hypothetical protein CK203_106095 [Vitis vinifera]